MNKEDSLGRQATRGFMKLAIEEMRKSEGPGPKVGVVLVLDGKVVSVGHRSQGIHAERAAIEAAQALRLDLSNATLFSTLEPCVTTGSAKEACARLIARVGIRTVFIGRYDTNPLIYREGWRLLRDAGLSLRDFDTDLRSSIDSINEQFVEHFVSGTGPSDGAKFDYLLNGGNFEIQYSDSDKRTILTQWKGRGSNSIYAYAVQPVRVALARHAREFSEVDDPRAFDFSYTVPVEVGEIAVFVCDTGAALVKVTEVNSGPDYGSDHTSVKIEYEIRAWG